MMNVSLDLFQVRDLIEKIREAFVETLDELQWMDEASKEKAREKVRDNKELQYSLMNMKYLAFCSIVFPVSLQTRGKDLGVHYYLVTLSFPFNPSLARINTNANWLQCNSQKKPISNSELNSRPSAPFQ